MKVTCRGVVFIIIVIITWSINSAVSVVALTGPKCDPKVYFRKPPAQDKSPTRFHPSGAFRLFCCADCLPVLLCVSLQYAWEKRSHWTRTSSKCSRPRQMSPQCTSPTYAYMHSHNCSCMHARTHARTRSRRKAHTH